MKYRTIRRDSEARSPRVAICAALLGSVGACSADDDPAASSVRARPRARDRNASPSRNRPAAAYPRPRRTRPCKAPLERVAHDARRDARGKRGRAAHRGQRGARQRRVLSRAADDGDQCGISWGSNPATTASTSTRTATAAAQRGSRGQPLEPERHAARRSRDADQRHHAGDLGNVRAEDDGTVKQWLRTKDLQLQGPAGIVGKAIVVHTGDDDLKSQPSGESGEPIACGVIKAIAN